MNKKETTMSIYEVKTMGERIDCTKTRNETLERKNNTNNTKERGKN